jgi:hypothetical protein
MDWPRKFLGQHLIDHPVTFKKRFSLEQAGNYSHAEMRLTLRPGSRMAGVQ